MVDCATAAPAANGGSAMRAAEAVATRVSVPISAEASRVRTPGWQDLSDAQMLIARPALCSRFLAGRRARYISPVRLYLTCSLLFFALSAIAPAELARFDIKETDVSSPAEREQAERAIEALRDLRERITHNAPRSMFVLMPVFGLLTWAFYRRAEPYYVPHLYYSIHFHSFVFLMMAAAELGSFGGRIGRVAANLP